MAVNIILSLCSLRNYRLLLLPIGVAAVVVLIVAQVQNDAFSRYGLTFGVVLFLLFVMNMGRPNRKLVALCSVPIVLSFAVFFVEPVTPAFAEEPLKPSFGNGRVHVRIYSDYFCHTCSKLDPEISATIANLVKKNVIRVTYIDTPVSQNTVLYARYFLYALNEKKNIDYANRVRHLLFQAADRNITDREKLEEYLKRNGVKYKAYDPTPTFSFLTGYLTEDQIRKTPTVVIIDSGRRQVVRGPANIVKAIGEIK
jgi:hypothetical protein